MLRLAIIACCCAAAHASPPSPAAALRAALAAGQAPPARVVTYDLRYAYALSAVAGYEEVALVAALAGLANRAAPVLLLDLEPPDAAWLASATARGGWLENTHAPALQRVHNVGEAADGPFLRQPRCFTHYKRRRGVGCAQLRLVAC
jgi:hypothetical protein